MSIGETLAQARQGSGLTVTQVSQRTRIRETLVKDIERDDYSGCGGDFYTRGHIRAIARVVGTDPEPLIEEYDAARRPPPADPAAAAPQFTVVKPHGWQRQPSKQPVAGAPPQVTPKTPAGWQQRQEPPTEPVTVVPPPVTPAGPGGLPEEPREPVPAVPPPVTPAGPGGRPGQPGEPAAAAPSRYTPAWTGGRQQRNWPVLFGLVVLVILGFLGYYFISDSGRTPAGTPAAGNHAASSGPGQAAQPGAGAAHSVVIHLTAIRASSVEFTTPGGRYLFRSTVAAGASRSWTFRRAVIMRLGNPGGVRLSVDGKNPLPRGSARPVTLSLSPGHPVTVASPAGTPTPAGTPRPAVPLTTSVPLTPAGASAFGVSGSGQGDNAQLAPLAIDGRRGTAWHSDWYTSAHFGNLYLGTGLLIDMGRLATITGAQISLGSAPGASFQLRVGSTPALTGLPPVARASGASGLVHLQLTTPARGRYVLIWFTKLPLSSSGNFEASVYNVRLEGRT